MLAEVEDTAACMQNRELSWLKFNERVLQESNRIETPLLERLKFISIFTSNLDEFFMIRVGALMDYALLDKAYRDNKTGMTAQEQLGEIFHAAAPLYVQREQAYSSVTEGLSRHGVQLLRTRELNSDEIKSLKKRFTQDIMPLLSPQIVDSRHPFPHLTNKQLHIAVTLEYKKGRLFGLIALPPEMDRLVLLEEGGCRFVLPEDVIMYFADIAFGTHKVLEKNIIAVTRNADINMEEDFPDEGIDYRQHMKDLLKKRQRLSPVRLELTYPSSREMLQFLCEKLSLEVSQVFYSAAPLDLSFCFSLDRVIGKETFRRLVWPAHIPAETLPADKKANMLKLAAGKDLLLSYPFESISPFLALIRQAAEDTSVLSIKITLYRIDMQSKLAESLILAAENGKEVIVLMELRARFDEKNNIEWAQRLEEAGCRIIYGLVGYKVHSKVCLITRREFGKVQYITQIGTGNYNEKTSKQYTDLSLITSDQEIGRDAASFFGNLLLGNLEGHYTHLWVAPGNFKVNILQSIEAERQRALNGEEGRIIIKCNSLTDKDIIEKLTESARDGVKISMIVRGICCLIPGIQNSTENIRVISIVGKFLEHSRIFCFGTGSQKKIYISSADLMTRNTQRRVEVACPILDAGLKDRIFKMMETMLMDNTQAWEQFSDGRYILRHNPGADLIINFQELFTQDARVNALHAETEKSKGRSTRLNSGDKFPLFKRVLRAADRFFSE
ncbi:MAG: polyphosphate kinase 1 [Oscillospiraceae bacterium]|jgi:polyphosphate kinase|nr:polyphosphate kinase 1 [Oscillospiraceae bacterium]